MVSLGSISLGSFQTASILLLGLFCYDIFWVFGTDVMMTVATKVEAPVKFLYTAPTPVDSDVTRTYPFSVLGLGDVVIPGLFVRFMAKVDEVLKPTKFSYFSAATIAYAVGKYQRTCDYEIQAKFYVFCYNMMNALLLFHSFAIIILHQ